MTFTSLSVTVFTFIILCNHWSLQLLPITDLVTLNRTLEWLTVNQPRTNAANPYCKICCIEIQRNTIGKKCGAHTMCKYNSKIGPSCKGYIPIYFTPTERATIVDAHNTLRNKVALGLISDGNPGPQPKASNMRTVTWSDELALVAERWAAQCVYGNDICRDLEKYPVGQNIARGNLATNSDLTLVSLWFDQVRFFNSNYVEEYYSADQHRISKYSQLVWADSYSLGCARAIFQIPNASRVYYRQHLICNYGPAGNIPHQPVYRIGEPCSRCPEGTDCNPMYPGLCWSDTDFDYFDYPYNNLKNSGHVCRFHYFLGFFCIFVSILLFSV